MKQHTNTPVPLVKMWTPYRTKSGFINKLMILKSRRVTGDQYFLIECSYKKNHYSTVKTLRKMHDWSIFMIALTSLLRLALQKKSVSTSNLITDDSPQNYFCLNPQKQVRAYIPELFLIHYYHFYFTSD